MARASRHTEAQRRDAVERAFGLAPHGFETVAAELGISPATLYRWARDWPREAKRWRERLLSAVRDLLRTATYGQVTVEQVAHSAGMSGRMAFHYYPTKEALFVAAIDEVAQRFASEVQRRRQDDPGSDSLERLQRLLAASIETAADMPDAHVLFRDVGVPVEHDRAQEWHGAMLDVMELHFRQAKANGALSPGLGPSSCAAVLSAAVRAAIGALYEGTDAGTVEAFVGRLPGILARPREP